MRNHSKTWQSRNGSFALNLRRPLRTVPSGPLRTAQSGPLKLRLAARVQPDGGSTVHSEWVSLANELSTKVNWRYHAGVLVVEGQKAACGVRGL